MLLAGAEKPANAVLYRGVVYVSLDALAEATGGKVGFGDPKSPLGVQPLRLTAAGRSWRFPNGGDRVLRLPGGKEHVLERPILVLDGKHFVPLKECSDVFGYSVAAGKTPSLSLGKKKIGLRVGTIDSAYHRHKVENLRLAHEAVVTREKVRLLRSLYKRDDFIDLPKGTTLLVRRKAVIDGTPRLVVSDCGPGLDSYVVGEKAFRQLTAPGKLDGTAWRAAHTWFLARSDKQEALRHGERAKLPRSVCVTVDLCWSLRRRETGLFAALRKAGRQKKVHPVLFVSGRWLDQHPGEMQELMRLGLQPGVELTWGLHSWRHPKSGGFMNDFTPAALRADTLKLEARLLEWGLVPTAFYRFPGLIHDTVRLREVLRLDLFPIDCDSWMALVGRKAKGPFAQPVQDGGIILVHGNGNEPEGVAPFLRWLRAHRDWDLRPIRQFLVPREQGPGAGGKVALPGAKGGG
jgi:hypothetical protein